MLKMKKLYRLMAGLLAALMICASVPSTAFAAEDNTAGRYTVKYQDENGDAIADEVVVNFGMTEELVSTEVRAYLSAEVNKDIPGYTRSTVTIDSKEDNGILLSTGNHEVVVTYIKNEEPQPEYITYKIVDAETEEYLTTWQVLEGNKLSTYSGVTA